MDVIKFAKNSVLQNHILLKDEGVMAEVDGKNV
jgi:hypothetical protein